MQAVQASALATTTAVWFLLSGRGTTAEEQQAGNWCVTASSQGYEAAEAIPNALPTTTFNLCFILAPGFSRLAYWDTAKNGLTPDQVVAGSNARKHWLCPTCDHSWQAKLNNKVQHQSGCPKCPSISKSWNRQLSLTQSQHPAMLEFDFERNRRAGIDPDKITAGSNKMVHWICMKCPKGQPHLFVASSRSRIGLKSGCPCCNNKKACICNSLQSLYPALAAEYDTARNGVGPEQVLSRYGKMAFWKDASGHTWEQTPAVRTKPEKDRIKRAAVSQRSKFKQQASSDLL